MNKYYISVGFISTEEEYEVYDCISYFFKNIGSHTFLYIECENGTINMFNVKDIDSIRIEEIKNEA